MQWPKNMTIRPIQQWPGALTERRTASKFSASWSDTIGLLSREIRALGGKDVVLQVAMSEADFRLDGFPRANAKATHPGVVLSLESPYGPLSWPCDTFTTWQDNIRAIALAMEALRKVDRYGVTKNGEQYRGWRQLPSGNGTTSSHMTEDEAWSIIGSFDGRPIQVQRQDTSGLPSAFKKARAFAHPDRHDGDRTLWDQVEQAAKVLGIIKDGAQR